jgi:soluble lytic murein transglycosylase-like protein
VGWINLGLLDAGWLDVFGIIKQKQYLTGLLVASLCGGAHAPAFGQVMNIGPDGNATIYKGPIVTSTDGVLPLLGQLRPITTHGVDSGKEPPSVAAAINYSASRHALSQALISAVAWQESRMRQEAVSPKGARGVMQLMPATASGLKVNADDLAANVDGGTAYLAEMLDRFDGDIIKTLAAYNAGPAAVERYHGVPPYPETQAYVSAVMNRLAESTNGKVHP